MANFTPVADPQSIAATQDVLKEVWPSDNIESQIYDDTVLLDILEKDVTEYTDSDGLKASVPLKVGRGAGMSARDIGEQLGAPSHPRRKKATFNYKFLYAQIQVLGPVVARMKTNRQSCVREIDSAVEDGIEAFQQDLVRMFQGDGSAQLTLAALPGGGSSTTVLLGAANFEAIDKGYLYEGRSVDIGTVANPVLDTGGNQIVSVVDSPTAPAIVLANATATTAGSHISHYFNRKADATGSREVNGLKNIASDTLVHGGIDPAVERTWKGVVENNAGTPRALSLDLLLTLRRRLRQRGGGRPDMLYGDLVQEQRYWNLIQPQVRFTKGETKGTGQFGVEFGDQVFIGDAQALSGRIYMGRKKALQIYSAGKMAWQNTTTGGDILAWVQDRDAFQARTAKYMQLGTNHRNQWGVLTDLN